MCRIDHIWLIGTTDTFVVIVIVVVVNGGTTTDPIPMCRISTLNGEIGYNSMQYRILVA